MEEGSRFFVPSASGNGKKKMKIYKAIHGDNLRRFKKQRDFLSQHSFDFNIVNPTIRILLLSTVYQLSAFERES